VTTAKALIAYDHLIIIFHVAPLVIVVPVKMAVAAFLPKYQKRSTGHNYSLPQLARLVSG
jgi:hypothetical protein